MLKQRDAEEDTRAIPFGRLPARALAGRQGAAPEGPAAADQALGGDASQGGAAD